MTTVPAIRIVARALVLATALVSACAEPRVREDTAAACSNGIDDNGDGRTDCADPACASSEACEISAATCANSIDDDGDGRIDCAQPSCRDGGFCEPFEAKCDIARDLGCPPGMACFAREVGGPVCAVPGRGTEGAACGDEASGPSLGCAAGHFCLVSVGDRYCYRTCANDEGCPRSSTCLVSVGQTWGVCSYSCLPQLACAHGSDICVALQRLGFSIGRGGWKHTCYPSTNYAPGTATSGAPCVDLVGAGTPLARVCGPGLLCVPDGDLVCRPVCIGSSTGDDSAPTCDVGRCFVVDPFDQREPRRSEDWRVGVCLP